MKNFFIDTNIIVDLIADRKPYSKHALEIFNRSEKKEIKLFTSSHSVATTHYLLKKHTEEKELRRILFDLLEFIDIIAVDVTTIKKALKSTHKDFEDAIQIICAYSLEKMDAIVTRNIKGFRQSEIPVFTPEELLSKL